MTNRSGGTRVRRAVVALAVGLALTLGISACVPTPQVTWSLGKTHGVVIETGGQRGSMNIYRSPRRLLMTVWEVGGINAVMDGMWAFGKAPKFKICAFAVCYDQDAVNGKIRGWIYGDPWDLKGALFDAQRNYNCLALTLISHGVYNKNWTNKSVGCALGSVPGLAETRSEPMADDGSDLVVAVGQPDDSADRPAGSDAPMPGPLEPAGTGPVMLP